MRTSAIIEDRPAGGRPVLDHGRSYDRPTGVRPSGERATRRR